MKKLSFLFVSMLVAGSSLVGCGQESGGDQPTDQGTGDQEKASITLLQNKPEIDDKLKAFATSYEEETGVEVVVKSCGGDACQLGTQLKADIAAGDTPDIFVIDGAAAYAEYESIIAPLDQEEWVSKTDVAFTQDGTVYGFPLFIEGYGLAYNKDLLDQAGIDVASLTSFDGYKAAFEKLDGMKEELGIDSVVSIAAGAGMEWVMRDHNLNAYLSNGIDRNDTSVVDQILSGEADVQRLTEYANWVNLLFDYADQAILTTGNYDDQVGAFANQKAVFVHQGNWIEPNLAALNATFNRGYAPQGSTSQVTDGIFVAAPSWYAVNKDSEVIDQAKDFLTYIATTDAGHNFIVNDLGAAPAFNNVESKPENAPLTLSVMEWNSAGKTYGFNQYFLPESFREALGPIYGLLAQDQITVEEFVNMVTEQVETLK